MIELKANSQAESSGAAVPIVPWYDPYDRTEPYNRTSWPPTFSALSPAGSVMAD
jgi:hypothetical protein